MSAQYFVIIKKREIIAPQVTLMMEHIITTIFF